jgi:hypothetical protein
MLPGDENVEEMKEVENVLVHEMQKTFYTYPGRRLHPNPETVCLLHNSSISIPL